MLGGSGSKAEMALGNWLARTTPNTGNPFHHAEIGLQTETKWACRGSLLTLADLRECRATMRAAIASLNVGCVDSGVHQQASSDLV